MHMLRNFVGIPERRIPVRPDFDIHINPVPEDPRAQQIHAKHPLLRQRAAFQIIFHRLVTCLVNHFVHGILENLICGFLDKKTDTQACNGIADRISKPCPRNTNQGAD